MPWQPGQSGNPRGRKPGPHTLARALREAFPREALVEMARDLARTGSEDTRRWVLAWLADRTEGKVTDKLELGPPGTLRDDGDDPRLAQLSVEDLRRLRDLERARREILDGNRDQNPKALDGAPALSPAVVAHAAAKPDEE